MNKNTSTHPTIIHLHRVHLHGFIGTEDTALNQWKGTFERLHMNTLWKQKADSQLSNLTLEEIFPLSNRIQSRGMMSIYNFDYGVFDIDRFQVVVLSRCEPIPSGLAMTSSFVWKQILLWPFYKVLIIREMMSFSFGQPYPLRFSFIVYCCISITYEPKVTSTWI